MVAAEYAVPALIGLLQHGQRFLSSSKLIQRGREVVGCEESVFMIPSQQTPPGFQDAALNVKILAGEVMG